MPFSGIAPPPFVTLAAHPLRWQLLRELATSDYRVRELVDLLGQPQNLVSYHLRLLRAAELVTSRRSSFDGRDSYYHLDLDRCAELMAATATELHPALRRQAPAAARAPESWQRRPRVLFACTGNSARSPIAEALLRHRAGSAVEVTSAGSRPKDRIHPSAVRVLSTEYGIDLSGRRPRHLDVTTGRPFDYAVTLCDKVREVCPELAGHPRRIHWSIPDPAPSETADRNVDRAVHRTAREIDTRIGHLLHLLADSHHGKDRP